MDIQFSPPLGQTLTASFPSSQGLLYFSCTFLNSSEAGAFKNGAARLQLWSDLPALGRESGEWGAFDFTPLQDRGELLALSLPVSIGHSQKYSFTYRMIQSSGEITWLGQFGRNGEIELLTGGGFEMADEWISGDDNIQHLEVHGHAQNLAHLEDSDNWKVFSLDKESSSLTVYTREAKSNVIASPLMTWSSLGVSLSLSRNGDLYSDGDGTVYQAPLNERTLQSVSTESPHIQVVHLSSEHAIVKGQFGSLVAVPLQNSPVLESEKEIFMPSSTLLSVASLPEIHLLYSADGVVSELSQQSSDIKLVVPALGTKFTNYVPHFLGAHDHVFIPSFFKKTSAQVYHTRQSGVLPTPPPSPRAHARKVSFRATPEVIPSSDRSLDASDSQTNGTALVRRQKNGLILSFVKRLFAAIFAVFGLLFRSKRKSPSSETEDERTPLLSERQSAEDVEGPSSSGQKSDVVPSGSQDLGPEVVEDSTVYVEVPQGEMTLIFSPDSARGRVFAEIDGHPLKTTKTKPLNTTSSRELTAVEYQIGQAGIVRIWQD